MQVQREVCAENDAKKMEGYRDKYLQLDQLVKQLYMNACDSTGLVNTKGAKRCYVYYRQLGERGWLQRGGPSKFQ